MRWLFLGALLLGVLPLDGRAQPARSQCDFGDRTFTFATADPVLQPYGYVLWRARPSPVAEPLAYAGYAGRRGQLTGRQLHRQGITWLEARMLDTCRPVYAEDASGYSAASPAFHLEMHGKIVFDDTLSFARGLIGSDVVVLGQGLEPNHRLYTPVRGDSFPLAANARLSVVSVDTHRYAHAKGVGPFFLTVLDAAGRRGLIKYNPRYIAAAPVRRWR